MIYYTLLEKQPIPEPDLIAWAHWFEHNVERCVVAMECVGPFRISTIFLGCSSLTAPGGMPFLFETMVFSEDSKPTEATRYTSWGQAVKGHKSCCLRVKEGVANGK